MSLTSPDLRWSPMRLQAGHSVYSNTDRLRWNPVRHHFELAGAGFHSRWYVEIGGYRFLAGLHGHCAVVVRTRVKHMARRVVGDAQQRVVAVRIELVAEGRTLREPVKLRAGDLVSLAACDQCGEIRNRRCP